MIRLELVAIDASGSPPAPAAMPAELAAEMACPVGMVASGGKCTTEKSAPYRCSGANREECLEQCSQGSPESCTIAAVLLGNTGRAAALHQRACDAGVALSCSRLGVAHFYGHGVERDPERAARHFFNACSRGNPDGCNNYGAVLDMGTGVTQDRSRAAQLFTWACNGGDAQGCFNAMVSFRDGRGVAPSPGLAEALRRRAEAGNIVAIFEGGCRGGNAYSCWGLGYLHQHGLMGQPISLDRARQLYERSCPGVAWGCDSLRALEGAP